MSQTKTCQLMNFCGYFLKRKTATKSIMFRGGKFEKSVRTSGCLKMTS